MRAEATLVNAPAAVFPYPYQGAGAGAVGGAADEHAGQQALGLEADAGVRQMLVGRRLRVGQQGKQAFVIGVVQGLLQALAGTQQLRPGRIEAGIGQPVDAFAELARLGLARIEVPQLPAVAEQQVETAELLQLRLQLGHELGRALRAGEKACRQLATRGAAQRLARIADIGQGGEAPVGAEAQPGAAGLQVTAGHQTGHIVPGRQRGGRAGIELVAVGGHQQGQGVAGAPGKDDQAHGRARSE